MAVDHQIAKADAYSLLADRWRRAVLRYLLDHPDRDQFTRRELVNEIAAWEQGVPVKQTDTDQRKRIFIALCQNHLPKLDGHGVVEYDHDRGAVEPTPLLAVFEPYVGDGLHDADDHLFLSVETDESEETGLTSTITGSPPK